MSVYLNSLKVRGHEWEFSVCSYVACASVKAGADPMLAPQIRVM